MVKGLSRPEVRFIVDRYYQEQENRKSARNQQRAAEEQGEAAQMIEWLAGFEEALENQIKKVLDAWTLRQPACVWARSQVGIGPVIAAGLAAHIDLNKTTSISKLWRFAGQDPTSQWLKGEKRPWNARLKVLCWKIGESFVKNSNNPNCFYGHIYREWKLKYTDLNEAGSYAQQAEQILDVKNIGKDTDAYAAYSIGKLPPAHIHARAKRKAVKMFLSHFWQVSYEVTHGEKAPIPWVIEHGGHIDLVPAPGWPIEVKG